MMELKVTMSYLPHTLSSYPLLALPKKLLKKLHIPVNQPVQLKWANGTERVICQGYESKASLMKLDERVAKKIGLGDFAQIRLKYHPHSQQLQIGPVLAILVTKFSKGFPPCGKLNSFCEEVIVYARNRHIYAYVTSLESLLKGGSTVRGWTFLKNRWVEDKFPFPQVVYNRIGTRRVENSTHFAELKEKLAEQRVQLFNQTFLDKWEVYEVLAKDKKIQAHLPKTQMFGPLALKSMLESYSTVFIKPINGSLGRGIYCVSRQGNLYVTQYTTPNGQIHKNFDKVSQLYSYLEKRVNAKKYIVQQGVHLLKYQNRTIDFRALMQKNSSGQWSFTSMVARIGQAHRFVSNIARGGELGRVLKVLNACRVPEPKKVRSNLLQVAKKACNVLEESYPEKFGELGVDLGVSTSGHVYLLEINSKPSKTDDTVGNSISKARPSVHKLLDYTQYLTKTNV